MTDLTGKTLHEAISEEKFDLPTLFSVLHQTSQALFSLHALGIGHGDLHPGNIVFGLADLSCLSEEQVTEKFTKAYGVKVFEISFEDGQVPSESAPPYYLIRLEIEMRITIWPECRSA